MVRTLSGESGTFMKKFRKPELAFPGLALFTNNYISDMWRLL
jgi:hypothetical protein